MDLADIRGAWAWAGLEPAAIVDINEFGNVLVLDTVGRYWRVCPEELAADVVAQNEPEFQRLRSDATFIDDWRMAPLVEKACSKLGPLPEGRCYCFKIPAVLGGAYDASNFGTISTRELISFAGDLAHQIRDLPDGSRVRLETTD